MQQQTWWPTFFSMLQWGMWGLGAICLVMFLIGVARLVSGADNAPDFDQLKKLLWPLAAFAIGGAAVSIVSQLPELR